MSYTGPINPFPNAKHLPVSLYGYVPNQGFNIFAAIAWGLVLAAHFWWLYKKGPRGAQSLVVFGCVSPSPSSRSGSAMGSTRAR